MPTPVPYQVYKNINAHSDGVNSVKWNNDGTYCMTCGNDKLCKLWNPFGERLIKVYKAHSYAVFDLAITSDNNYFASAGQDRSIFIWDVTRDVPLRKLRGHQDQVNCLSIGAGDSILASGSNDGTLRLWDIKSKSMVPVMTLQRFTDSVTSVHIQGVCIVAGCVDGYVRNYDIRSGTLNVDCIGKPITNVHFSEDGNCILVQTLDSHVRLMDVHTGECLMSFNEHSNDKYRVGSCLLHGDEYLVSGSENADIVVYEILSGKSICSKQAHRGCITSVAAHPKDSGTFLSSGTDSSIKLWCNPTSIALNMMEKKKKKKKSTLR
eukprot:NODE_5346_length_1026_cov_59.942414_g4777_i0.p1 GENE.NODE_5346_length_1026_cov_59.942414_g4777_i0~~NODE_5346_length_1026_cov_59.942414_g4777_i0.p1  ORF type:complete len:321 (+),score=35.52 NODE_5346_length_1026_cov_59.942414_g4777_i0:62-1024(+)